MVLRYLIFVSTVGYTRQSYLNLKIEVDVARKLFLQQARSPKAEVSVEKMSSVSTWLFGILFLFPLWDIPGRVIST